MPKIIPFLAYNDQAEEAATFYVSVFDDARILEVTHFGEGGPLPAGSVMTVAFQIGDQVFVAMNGGPHFTFSDGVSFAITCETQEEIDRYWAALTEGGEPGQCGWLTDRFGLVWQVSPRVLPELLTDPDPARANRVMQAMLQMSKIDLAALQAAYDG